MKRSQSGFIGKCSYHCGKFGRKRKNNSKCSKCKERQISIVTNKKLHLKIELDLLS